ncbi:MAG: metal ABC transporter permease [Clostridia bacterium]|nr:metal ABC transporter permease [Clostridia bacterium]
MNEIISILNYTFIQRALICGILISLCAALVGVVLVLKNYSMIGHGLGEVGFAALALAVALNLPPIYVSVPLVVVASFIIMFISQRKGESGDITIALVSTGALAIGIIITSISTGFNVDVANYMFGSILSMTKTDVIISVIVSIVLILCYVFFYNRLFLVTYDESYAKTKGISVTTYQFLISFLTAIIVVLGMRMMGTLLISSLIVFPAFIAKGLTSSFKELVVSSAIISIVCFILGIILSFFVNLPTGASIAIIYIGLAIISKVMVRFANGAL